MEWKWGTAVCEVMSPWGSRREDRLFQGAIPEVRELGVLTREGDSGRRCSAPACLPPHLGRVRLLRSQASWSLVKTSPTLLWRQMQPPGWAPERLLILCLPQHHRGTARRCPRVCAKCRLSSRFVGCLHTAGQDLVWG